MANKKLKRSYGIKEWLQQDYERNKFNIMLGGWTAFVAHPVYFLFCTLFLTGYYDSPFFRFGSALISIPLMFEPLWPAKAKPWLNLYWYLWVTFVLPISFTFIFAMNNLVPMWLVCEVMMIFVALIFIGNIIRMLLVLGVGIPLGYICFNWYTGHVFTWTQVIEAGNHPLWHLLVPLPIALWCGVVFMFGARKGIVALEKNQAITALAGSIAHEMRNPLSQIKASLDGIEKNLPLPNSETTSGISLQRLKNLYEYVGVGESAIKRGLQVIAMILDEVKDKPIDRQEFNYLHAAHATQKAIDEYAYETDGEREKINLEVKQDFIFKGDETLYLFVLFNLIKNALYYFKLDPQAKLAITVDQSCVIVRDTGPGIKKEHVLYLFNSFHTAGKQGGTGLGLAYCKRVMQAFGGDIRCHSVFGQYTEFILNFPEISAPIWQQYQSTRIEHLRLLLSGKQVLVVDDDETIRRSTQKILSGLGIQADHAENGQQALQQLEQTSYDLMLLDLNMPILDGYSTAEKIRAGVIPGYEQLPIIAYTTEVAYMAQVKTQKVGINAFISKPCEPLVLIQTIEQVLHQKPVTDKSINTLSLLRGKTILVADDSETNRDLIKHVLEKHGIHLLEAAHGQAAIDQLDQNSECAAVLMDIHMPGIDGLEASRLIRNQTSAYQSVPIIAITGDTDKENITAAFALGIDDYIVKPVDSHVLLKKLTMLCNRGQEKVSEIPLFDCERLDHFKENGIFKDGVDNSYVRQTTEHLIVLENSVKNQDFERIQDALHFLKGSSFTVGAQAFAHLIENYEQQAKKGDWPDEEYWLEKIKSLHGQTLAALQAYFKQPS